MTINNLKDFNKIKSYSEKLIFWDKHLLNPFNIDFTLQDITITLKPELSDEKKIYTKWMINHWRHHYIKKNGQDPDEDEHRSKHVFKPFESYVSDFQSRKYKAYDHNEFIELEKERILYKIKYLSRNCETLRSELFKAFRLHLEDEIFERDYDYSSDIPGRLRQIGMLWDLIKYHLYLQHQASQKNHGSVKKDEFAPIAFSEDQISYLYKEINNDFITRTSFDDFKGRLKGESTTGKKVVWSDLPEKNRKAVNKKTLLTFVMLLSDSIHAHLQPGFKQFVLENFEVEILSEDNAPLSDQTIKNTIKEMTKRVPSKREELLKKIMKLVKEYTTDTHRVG